MGLFLVIALISWAITKSIHNGVVDHTYAKQGMVSPRLQAKYGDSAQAKTAKYGFFDYLDDAWSDYWRSAAQIRAVDRQAHVEQRIVNPKQRVTWRQRWTAVKEGMARAGRVLVEPVGAATADRPVVEPESAPRVVDTGDVPAGTRRFTDDGEEEWTGAEWVPVHEPVAVTEPEFSDAAPATEPTSPDPSPSTSPEPLPATGGTMTAPTGEAVNYETTVNELEAQAAVQREHVDACAVAVKAMDEAAAAVDGMQETYRSASAAAASHLDHLTNLNLDGTTVGHVGDTADALPAGVVDTWFTQIEEVKSAAEQRLQAAEAALAATEAALAHVQATYGDANATVAENLGGDSRFLDSGGGAGAATHATGAAAPATPEPAPAVQEPVAV